MPDVYTVLNEFGHLPDEQSRKARVAVAYRDGPPATLIMLTDEGTYVAEVDSIVRPNWSGYVRYHINTVDGRRVAFVPSTCDCGGGAMAYADLFPGENQIPVRMPSWLEAEA